MDMMQELFATENGAVHQAKRHLLVTFAGTTTPFNIPAFWSLKKRVDAIKVEEMANNPSRAYDCAIISPCGSERCYVLSLAEVIEFQDLLGGAKLMLELNSILHEQMYAVA
jgi:hypothetical protein